MPEYSAKRNQARQKLSDLKENKFEELTYTILLEMEARFGKKNHTMAASSSMESLSPSSIPIQKVASRSITPVGLKDSHKSSHSNVNRDTMNFEGLDNMMQELNLMIGKEQDMELQALKTKYQQEVLELRGKLELLEQIIIPQKNQEIAKLISKIDNFESKLMEAKKDANQYFQSCQNKDKTIEEQKVLINNLQCAYQQLQSEIIIKNKELVESEQQQLQLESLEQPSSNLLENLKELSTGFDSKMEQTMTILNKSDTSSKEILYSIKDLCGLSRKLVKFVGIHSKVGGGIMVSSDISESKSKTLESVTYLIACCKDIATNGASGTVSSNKNVFTPLKRALDSLKVNMKNLLNLLPSTLPFTQNGQNENVSKSINNIISPFTMPNPINGGNNNLFASNALFDSHPRFNSTVSLPASQIANSGNGGGINGNGINSNNGQLPSSSKEVQDIISLIHSKSDKVLTISEELLQFSRHCIGNSNRLDDSSSPINSPHLFKSFFSSFGSSFSKRDSKRQSINALLPQHHLNMVNDMVGHLLVLIYRAKPILEDRKELHAMLELMEDSIQTLHREVVRTGGKISKIDALGDIEAACSTIYKAMRQLESSV